MILCMNMLNRFLLIRRLKADVRRAAKSLDASYELNHDLFYDTVLSVERYFNNARNHKHIAQEFEGYRLESINYFHGRGFNYKDMIRGFVIFNMYYMLTYSTGGTGYGHLGVLNARGVEAVALAEYLSSVLKDRYGYFREDGMREDDLEDFKAYLKKTT